MFTMILKNLSNYTTNLQIVKLSAGGFVRRICEIGDSKKRRSKLKCTNYTIVTYLYDYNFNKEGKYQMSLPVFDKSRITLQFSENYMKQRYSASIKLDYDIPYNNLYYQQYLKKYKNKYKLFYRLRKLSWALAYAKCLKHEMILPNFNNLKHLQGVINYIFKKYQFYPKVLFVGFIKKVGEVINRNNITYPFRQKINTLTYFRSMS